MRRAAAFALTAVILFSVRASAEQPLRISVSFYPIYIAALNVAAGIPGVELSSMTRPGAGCLHDYQLSPGDMAEVSKADVFIVNGAGMESFLGRLSRINPRMTIIDASAGLKTIADEHGANPHLWLSPSLHIQQVQNIAEGLAQRDPFRAENYRRNAAQYSAELNALREKIRQTLSGSRTKKAAFFHNAFGYFAEEFQLEVAAVIEEEPGVQPAAGRLVRSIQTIRRAGVRAIFADRQYSPRSAEMVARESGAQVFFLDSIVDGPQSPDAYLRIMERNLGEFKQALP